MQISRTFISPEELTPGRVVTYAEVAALAATLNRAEALHFLGFLNLLLSSATTEMTMTGKIEPVRDVQMHVFRQVVSESLLGALKAKFGNASLLEHPVLHRSQMLFAIRLVATHGNPDGGNTLQTRQDFDVVGDMLFLINGLFHAGAPASGASTALWLATHMGPLHETENPPDVELSWPRIEELIAERLPAVAAAHPDELERLQQVSVFATGFSIRAWIDLSWLLFSFWADVTFEQLMENRGRGYLDPNREHEIISGPVLRRAVEGLSVDFADLPKELRIEEFTFATLFDHTPFRTKPLWRMPDGLVLCVDNAFLMERMGAHVFWAVMNSLDTPERRNQFGATWGKAFEAYALDRLGRMFSTKSWWYAPNLGHPDTNEEISDAIAVHGDAAIVVECKGTFVKSEAKYSGVPGRFFRGLTKKFGRANHGGVCQLARAVENIWASPTVGGTVKGASNVTDIFPLLILLDPIADCGPVVRVLSDRMLVATERIRWTTTKKRQKIWPLTVITPNDLDRLDFAVAITQRPLPELLRRFHRHRPSRACSLGDFLVSKDAGDFVPREQVYEKINKRFKESTQGTLERFRAAEYQA